MPKVKRGTSKISDGIETWHSMRPLKTLSQIVYARMNGPMWWPGVVIEGIESGQHVAATPGKEWIFWYGDGRISLVTTKNICSFRTFYNKLLPEYPSKRYKKGIEAAIDDCAFQDGMNAFGNEREKLEWAENGFLSKSSKLVLSDDVKQRLEDIKKLRAPASQNEVQKEKKMNFLEKKIEAFPGTSDSKEPSSLEEDGSSKMSFFKTLQKYKLNAKNICISCRKESKEISCQHPIFQGGLCEECKERVKNYMFVLDDDDSMIACAVCARTGEVIVCDHHDCSRVYCVACINELAGENAVSKFKKQSPWHCMLCRGYDRKTDGYLVPKEYWWDNVTQLFMHHITHQEMEHTNKIVKKDGIKVLSLFDGISTGYYCLTKLGFNIDVYYALEIDNQAINVSKMNFSDKITHLGDVEKFTSERIASLCPFDLVIGGSPCNDLSAVNPARKGLYEPEGTGRLFFEYYRVLTTVRSFSPNPVFWLYENVASMPVPYRHIINRFLNCEPSLIDAKHFSAQRRPRFYWGNIPGMSSLVEITPNASPNLSSVVMSNCERTAAVDKINTVTTQRNSLKSGNQHPVIMDGQFSGIWVTELEEVFGFPRHFTDVGYLIPQQRLGLLGKSWSVQVIVNILKSLNHFFHTKPGLAHHQ